MNRTERKLSINRFQELRESEYDDTGKVISKTELAKRLSRYCVGINRQKIQNIENGEKRIDADIFRAYMQYFHVSADYLLGFSNTKKGFDADLISCADFLGIDRKTVETILTMTNNDVQNQTINNIKWVPDDFKKNIKKKYDWSAFAFDWLLSDEDNISFDLLEKLFLMIRDCIRIRFSNDPIIDDNLYKVHMFDIQEMIFLSIEHELFYIDDIDDLKKYVKSYDSRHNSNIYNDIFGDNFPDPRRSKRKKVSHK